MKRSARSKSGARLGGVARRGPERGCAAPDVVLARAAPRDRASISSTSRDGVAQAAEREARGGARPVQASRASARARWRDRATRAPRRRRCDLTRRARARARRGPGRSPRRPRARARDGRGGDVVRLERRARPREPREASASLGVRQDAARGLRAVRRRGGRDRRCAGRPRGDAARARGSTGRGRGRGLEIARDARVVRLAQELGGLARAHGLLRRAAATPRDACRIHASAAHVMAPKRDAGGVGRTRARVGEERAHDAARDAPRSTNARALAPRRRTERGGERLGREGDGGPRAARARAHRTRWRRSSSSNSSISATRRRARARARRRMMPTVAPQGRTAIHRDGVLSPRRPRSFGRRVARERVGRELEGHALEHAATVTEPLHAARDVDGEARRQAASSRARSARGSRAGPARRARSPARRARSPGEARPRRGPAAAAAFARASAPSSGRRSRQAASATAPCGA